jgi:hypothetical protein
MRLTALSLILWFAPLVLAQSDAGDREAEELRRQQIFRSGIEKIVSELNAGDFKGYVRAIDQRAMLERIYGLRLIDTRMKRDFSERMDEPDQFALFIAAQYAAEAKDGIKARLLRVESRGTRGVAVVRFDMAHFQSSYIEYDLQLDDREQLEIIDWTDYLRGHKFTDYMGLTMVQAQPSQNAARKLVDYSNVQQAEIFQLMEVLKATRDRNLERYFQIVEGLNENLKKQRVIWQLGLDSAQQARKRRDQRRILVAIDQYYPQDVLFALPLLDYYFPDGQYQKAYDALVRVRDKLQVDDAVTNARLSSASLVLKQPEEANRFADAAVEQEPSLELGWWSLLRARTATADFAGAVTALQQLKSAFGYELGPDQLGKDPSMKAFLGSPAYQAWLSAGGP